MQNIYWSIILLGHGIKPFGYAVIDELFPFFSKNTKNKICRQFTFIDSFFKCIDFYKFTMLNFY